MSWTGFFDALGADRYVAHAICLSFDPLFMFMYTLADLSTFLAYLAIGLCLLFIDKPPTEIRPPLRLLFGSFIALCGLSHLTMVMTLYIGVYRLDILVRAAMGGVSVTTAFVVVNDFLLARGKRPAA